MSTTRAALEAEHVAPDAVVVVHLSRGVNKRCHDRPAAIVRRIRVEDGKLHAIDARLVERERVRWQHRLLKDAHATEALETHGR